MGFGEDVTVFKVIDVYKRKVELHTTNSTCEYNGAVLLKSVMKLGEHPTRGVCGVFRSFVGGRGLKKKMKSVKAIPVYIISL